MLVWAETFQKRLANRLGLMQFNFADLCVDADPSALLSMKVQDGGEPKNIEDVVDVVKDDWNVFILIPKDKNCDIGAVKSAVDSKHPEFRQELVILQSDTDEDGVKALQLTVPPVDQNRHDLLIQGVDAYVKAFKTQADLEKAVIMARLALPLMTASKEEKEACDASFNEAYDNAVKSSGELADAKKKSIDEAFEKYQEQQAQNAAAGDGPLSAPDAAFSMKMG